MSASPAPSIAPNECAQGIPVVTIGVRLDTNTVSVFNSPMASLHNESLTRIPFDPSPVGYVGSTGPFFVPEPTMELTQIPGIRPMLGISPDREIALNGGAA